MAKSPSKSNPAVAQPKDPAAPPPPAKLTDDEVQERLASVPDWAEIGGQIQRTYAFKDFANSMKFVAKVAQSAETDQHHPDILIRYNKVTLTLTTHDAGGISDKDFALARTCDSFIAAKK